MSQLFMALALAMALGGLRLFAGAASSTDVGSQWDPDGSSTVDVGGQWDPNGQPAPNVGSRWDPNG